MITHPKYNMKREQLRIVRDIEIDHENQNLLRKINDYHSKKNTLIKNEFLPGITSTTNNSISYANI